MDSIKIVWVCNKMPTKVSKLRDKQADNFGGWIDWTCEELSNREDIHLCVLFPDITEYEGGDDSFSYYSFHESDCMDRFEFIIEKEHPDVIHMWGTEFGHSNETMKVCQKLGLADRCIISIQGLVSLYGKRHYIEGVPDKIVRRYTLRDFLKRSNIQKGREQFIQRGRYEIEALKRTKHIIGRTDWDRAASQMFNPEARYHFCNESLRDSFYENRWDLNRIERYSIFVSQCSYPIKGFHYVLEALPEILKRHPDAHVYTTGKDLLSLSRKGKLLITSYQKYLLELIDKYDLRGHVSFLGNLSETEMCKQYLKANVFVSASTIENSPNSVGEAMIVGCPVVSSDVGGVKNLLEHNTEGFVYQSSAPYMLAYYVNRVFEDDDLAIQFSKNARNHASKTHNREVNMETLLNIYKEVVDCPIPVGGGTRYLPECIFGISVYTTVGAICNSSAGKIKNATIEIADQNNYDDLLCA